jgi:hypothetical protein
LLTLGGACDDGLPMPHPDLLIWAVIGLALIALWPIRRWIRSRYDRDDG